IERSFAGRSEAAPSHRRLGPKRQTPVLYEGETRLESWGIPSMDSQDGLFYGADIEYTPAPVAYGRVILGGGSDYREMQADFLRSLNHPLPLSPDLGPAGNFR